MAADEVIAIDIRLEYTKHIEDADDPDGGYTYYELSKMSRIRNDLGDAAESLGEHYMQSDRYHVKISPDLIGVIASGDVVNYGIH